VRGQSVHLAVRLLSPDKSFDVTIECVDGGYSSAAERLTVAQDVVGSIPTSRPNSESITYEICSFPVALQLYGRQRKEYGAVRPQDSNRFRISDAESTSGSDLRLNEWLSEVTSLLRFQPLSSHWGP
jgi:hypothetical protein